MALFHLYPYSDFHDLNLDWILKTIKELKEQVDQMDMETLLSRLTEVETELNALSGTVNTLGNQVSVNEESIRNINGTIDDVLMDIGSIKTRLTNDESTIEDIQTTLDNIGSILEPIEADVTALTSQVTAIDGRVTALESATFEAPTESNFNLFVGDMVNLSALDYSIVEVTNNGQSTNNIRLNNDLIRFYHSSSNNEMALVIKNVLPYYTGNPYNGKILSFANRYKTSGSSNGIDYCINVPFTSLTGNTPYIANSGYTTTRATMRVLQLKRSTDDNNFYDLWIYNRYQGQYGILIGADVDFLNLVMVMREIDATQSTDNIKSYFVSELNSTGKQVSRIIDKKAPSIVSTATQIASQYDQTVLQDAKDYADLRDTDQWHISSEDLVFTVDDLCFHEPSETGGMVEIVPNSQLPSDCLVDFTGCMASRKRASVSYDPLENNYNEIDWFINIEVTLSGSSAVNLGGAYTYVGFFRNEKNAVPVKKIPLTIHHNIGSIVPVYVDAYYNTVGNVGFRINFDDTNWDYTNHPIKLCISGFVPLRYLVNVTP